MLSPRKGTPTLKKRSSSRVGAVRVIGGRWRGRKLDVIDSPGLRPTPDRLRETLFNWLAPILPGARCLDLFAGSGALGIEAASRGAASVTLVERDSRVARHLRENLARLINPGEDTDCRVEVLQADWANVLKGSSSDGAGPWDIVFVDPPFADGLHTSVLDALAAGRLAEGARIHLESGRHDAVNVSPQYAVLKDKRFGDVQARLLSIEM